MKNIVLSLDGLTFRFVKSYLENGQLDANTGLGYLINKGVFVPTTVTTPANTAPPCILRSQRGQPLPITTLITIAST
jgi:hypothetical protein